MTLYGNNKQLGKIQTDIFGDFKFGNLKEERNKYRIEVLFKDYEKKVIELELNNSMNVGTILFEVEE